ncbi:hypothetical protein EG68_09020 [Paragonimus skrjabini miyazakii]|uniref:Transmembrane protein 62 n=1 Tax=Paragonimus skrjabini miyazakii TaxID=59628 RepID=A0A8S9Y856_9TREM|nr:hypothetical protein EG68_09020 [Paragonimus skrjabini miyazakii]
MSSRTTVLLTFFLFVSSSVVFRLLYVVVDVRSHSVAENELRTRVMKSTPSLTAADDLSNIFWFIQVMLRLPYLTFKVSDLHISVFDEITRITDFQNFCENNIKIVRPELLLISGDLTDAKTSNKHASLQVRSEWEIYASILRKTNLLNITHWLDIRGNHEGDFPWFRMHWTLRKYAARGQLSTLSYLFTLRKPYGNYSFIALDACPDPGLSRPLNFFGVLTQDTERALRRFVEVTKRDNHTFWFGHYPTSTIVPSSGIRSLISSNGFAYLCGHLHTWLGWAPEMYALQPHGFLELELGDWRDNRRYRILAVDHDLVSFVDVQFRATNTSTEWPVVLITNPKHANFLLPHKEPVDRIARSTHIRILAWSKWPIVQVSVRVDDIPLGNAIKSRVVDLNTNAPNPLYVLPWDPNIWNTHSVHTIQVTVHDSAGNFRVVTQPFIIQGTPPWNFSFLSSFLLNNDHTFNLRATFYGLWFLLIGTLTLPRILNRISIRRMLYRTCLGTGIYRLSNCDNLMYAVAFYLVYVVSGPIFMGYLVQSHFGVVFSFGVYIAGAFVAESLTYFHEVIQLLIFIPVLLGLIWHLGYTHTIHQTPASSEHSAKTFTYRAHCRSLRIFHIPISLFFVCSVFTVLQIRLCLFTIYYPYGVHALFLSPGRIGPLVLAWYLAYNSHVPTMSH